MEGVAGWITGSLARLADAAHNLTDVAGLLIAWGAAVLAKRAVTARHTWGLGRATILAALFNAIAILVGVSVVTREAVQRLSGPVAVPVPGLTVMLAALIGIGVNTGSAMPFISSRKGDLNPTGAFLHMAADAAVSGAVVLARNRGFVLFMALGSVIGVAIGGQLLGIVPEAVLLPVLVAILRVSSAKVWPHGQDQVAADRFTRFTNASAVSLRSE